MLPARFEHRKNFVAALERDLLCDDDFDRAAAAVRVGGECDQSRDGSRDGPDQECR